MPTLFLEYQTDTRGISFDEVNLIPIHDIYLNFDHDLAC
jgi:hypothetical protein